MRERQREKEIQRQRQRKREREKRERERERECVYMSVGVCICKSDIESQRAHVCGCACVCLCVCVCAAHLVGCPGGSGGRGGGYWEPSSWTAGSARSPKASQRTASSGGPPFSPGALGNRQEIGNTNKVKDNVTRNTATAV